MGSPCNRSSGCLHLGLDSTDEGGSLRSLIRALADPDARLQQNRRAADGNFLSRGAPLHSDAWMGNRPDHEWAARDHEGVCREQGESTTRLGGRVRGHHARRTPVRALDSTAHLQNGRAHHMTSRAPSLIETDDCVIFTEFPLELISTPDWSMTIFEPFLSVITTVSDPLVS